MKPKSKIKSKSKSTNASTSTIKKYNSTPPTITAATTTTGTNTMPVLLKYKIPKNISASIAAQLTAFSFPALTLQQPGELEFLNLAITNDVTTDEGTHLERNLELTEVVPDFVNAFGPSENPAVWNLQTLWGDRIEKALSTSLVP